MPITFKTIVGLLILLVIIAGVLWVLVRSIKSSDDPAKLLCKYIITFGLVGAAGWALADQVGFSTGGAFIVPFVAVALGVFMSLIWTPNIGALLAKPLTSLFDGGDTAPKLEAMYSIAIGKRKAGKYSEAVQEIRRQLQKFPDDVTGQMMLAEVHAENLNDLPTAQLIIDRFCEQRGHAPRNLAYALNVLADWHLKYGQDIETARATLERIPALLPNSEEALAAAQRLSHLGTTQDLLNAREAPTIRMKAGVDNIGLMKNSASLRRPEEDPAVTAGEYVKHLQQFPLDGEIREKLALIYAEHYQRLDLATNELNQLAEQPSLAPKQVARLLHLIADLHIKHAADCAAAQLALERIVEKFPTLGLADIARQRLSHLRLELKGSEKAIAVKLGEYEQNIGLKKRS